MTSFSGGDNPSIHLYFSFNFVPSKLNRNSKCIIKHIIKRYIEAKINTT